VATINPTPVNFLTAGSSLWGNCRLVLRKKVYGWYSTHVLISKLFMTSFMLLLKFILLETLPRLKLVKNSNQLGDLVFQARLAFSFANSLVPGALKS
jgi:hypothetical protein